MFSKLSAAIIFVDLKMTALALDLSNDSILKLQTSGKRIPKRETSPPPYIVRPKIKKDIDIDRLVNEFLRTGNEPFVYTTDEIKERRRYIRDIMVTEGMKDNFKRITKTNLKMMWNLYEKYFYGKSISKKLDETESTIKFRVTSGGKTGVGGSCATRRTGSKCIFTITFPLDLYRELFRSGEETLKVNGLTCQSRLECMQMVFEHETVHLVMQLFRYQGKISEGRGKNIYTAHGTLFKTLASVFFGHTDFRHNLRSGDVSAQLTRSDVPVGTKVKFEEKGKIIQGVVVKHNPRTIGVRQTIPKPKYSGDWRIPIVNLMLDDDPSAPGLEDIEDMSNVASKMQKFPLGSKVKFKHRGRGRDTYIYGTIIKHNPKNIKVTETRPIKGRIWSVHPNLLELL